MSERYSLMPADVTKRYSLVQRESLERVSSEEPLKKLEGFWSKPRREDKLRGRAVVRF